MWFGTKDGLNRFDGSSFKTFRFSPDAKLRENVFTRVVQDKDDNFWLGTEDGVYIYNPREDRFAQFETVAADSVQMRGVVSDLVLDNDGDVWISVEEKGVFHFDFQSRKLNHYPVPLLPGGMKLITLCADKDKMWVFPYGLPFLQIDKKNGKTTTFQLNDNPALLYNLGEVWTVKPDDYNQLLVSSSTQGFVSINTVNKTHRILLDKDASGHSLFVRCSEKVDRNTIWVGSESGLYIYDAGSGKALNLRHNAFIPSSISDNAIYSIYKDKNDGVWVGSYFGGVDYYSSRNNQFELFYPIAGMNEMKGVRIREFCPDPDGNIWIGSEDNGLNLFDPRKNEFLPLPNALSRIYTNIHALQIDGDYLWIATFSKGLNRYNRKTGELLTFHHSEGDASSISNNSTFAICKDRQNMLWIGNLSGLDIYDYDKNNFSSVEQFNGVYVQDIFEDTQGQIWVSTFKKGLHRYDPATKKWTVFLYDSADAGNSKFNKLTSVFEDSHRRLWITTEGGGFYLFERETGRLKPFNSAWPGLPNDVVYRIEEDNDGFLWLSTNKGLVQFDPNKQTLKNYTIESGLKTNQFNYKSSYKAPDGTLYFGSIEGFVRFDPSRFKSDEDFVPPIVFTDFYINNKPVTPQTADSPLKQNILYTDEIVLPYRQNSFSVRYAVLDYSNMHTYKTSYKLEGFDKEWIDANRNELLVYSNLKPGDYRLTVRLNEDGQSVIDSKTIDIHIHPPFWMSKWAYFVYALLFLGVLTSVIYSLNRREKRKQLAKMRLFQRQKERELYESKIDFFTNVAHEIRTPLSLIKAPLDYVLLSENVSENVRDNLQIMGKNTDRLLNLTNQLLDFRKTESDAYLLKPQIENVSELIRDTFLRFTPVARQRKLDFALQLPGQDLFVHLDKEAFLKISSNLLGNALKYCEKHIRVKAYLSGGEGNCPEFHLVTENDGELIPSQYKDEIFKPFVHIDKKSADKIITGTGIGLALSRSLAELHGGSLSYEGDAGYNRFHLVVPMGKNEALKDEDSKVPETQKPERMPDGHTHGFPHTILLVEDDVELLAFEKQMLGSHYNVLVAESAHEALKKLKNESVHLIVSDVMMPGIDGFEFTRRVKSDINSSHIPIILLTAKTNIQSKVEGFETGADAYIDKPFSVEVLMARIANLLQSRAKLRETFMKHPFIGAKSIATTKSDNEFIEKLQQIVLQHIGSPDFVVEDIAEQFSMSRASFYRKIKGVMNLTPNEYIRVERMKRAAQLLREKRHKVNEICFMVGFNSPSYFSKCFQQQFGVLPKDFE